MSNHIHVIWQVQEGYTPHCVQRDFLNLQLKLFSVILKVNHPSVLERFLVNAKDRKYQFWERNSLSIDLWTKEIFLQKMEYLHQNAISSELCRNAEKYKYSSAKFYETGIDDFGFIKHWME